MPVSAARGTAGRLSARRLDALSAETAALAQAASSPFWSPGRRCHQTSVQRRCKPPLQRRGHKRARRRRLTGSTRWPSALQGERAAGYGAAACRSDTGFGSPARGPRRDADTNERVLVKKRRQRCHACFKSGQMTGMHTHTMQRVASAKLLLIG
jgi:hypothetical protein